MRARCALALCLLACSSENASNDGGADASIDAAQDAASDAPQETGKDGGPTACNTVANVGTVIQQTYVATAPVTGDGGVLVEGTYVLTAAAAYTGTDGGSGPTGTTFQDTAVLDDAGAYQRVVSIVNDAGLDGSPIHQNGSFVLNGSSIQVTQTCPPGSQPFTSYDSDGTKFHVYAPAAGPGNPAVMFEYTKQ
jgi:hypothetical protein